METIQLHDLIPSGRAVHQGDIEKVKVREWEDENRELAPTKEMGVSNDN